MNIIKHLISCLLLVMPFAVSADILYSVSPLVIDTKAVARDIITKEISIHNTGTQPITVYPTVNNISMTDGGTIQEFISPSQSDRTSSLASWIEISRLGFDLQPNEIKSIPLTLRINPNPVPGTYHALVGFGWGENRDQAESQIREGRAPGTMITVTIDEESTTFARLSRFIVSRFVVNDQNQAAVYTIHNPGDEPIKPEGEIIIYDGTGKEVGSIPVNEAGTIIQPGSEQVFSAQIPTQGLLGRYKAFLTVEYGKTEKASMYDTYFFYIFPIKKLLIIVSILIVFVGLVAWYVHKKYFVEDIDDSEQLMVRVRASESEPKHHDIDLTKI